MKKFLGIAAEVKINIPDDEAMFSPSLLFQQKLPIQEVAVSNGTTTTTGKYSIDARDAPTVIFHKDFESFVIKSGEKEEEESEKKIPYPVDSMPVLNNEASVNKAFEKNVLISLRNVFRISKTFFKIASELPTVTSLKPDLLVQDSENNVRVVIEVKPWYFFMNRDRIRADVTDALKQCCDEAKGIIDPSRLLIDANLPQLKEGTPTAVIRNLQGTMEQLVTYLMEFDRKRMFGVITTYIHSYLVLLDRTDDDERPKLHVSPAILYSDENILGHFFKFFRLALGTPIINLLVETTVTITPVMAVQRERGSPVMTRSKKKLKKGGDDESSKDGGKEGGEGDDEGSKDGGCNGQASGKVYRLAGCLATGRTGSILQMMGPDGKQYAVKVIGGHRRKARSEIMSEMENEVNMYAALQNLQGTVVPRFFLDGNYQGKRYCLVLEKLAANSLQQETGQTTEEEKDAIVDALDQIHALRIIHGDVRAPNIMLQREPKFRACFVDFGFSRKCDVEQEFRDEKRELLVLLGRESA